MDINNIRYEAEGAYPQLANCVKNRKDCLLLKEAYAGKESELTAVTVYSYQHLVIAPFGEEIAKLFENISIVEMRHVELLGKAIIALGGNPTYFGGTGTPWSGSFANYSTNLKTMLLTNVKAEENAIAYYRYIIAHTGTPCIVPLIERIIEDEICHLEAFNELLKQICFWS